MSTCYLIISMGLILGNFVQIKITQEKAKHSALFPFFKAEESLLKRLSKLKVQQLEMIKYYIPPSPPPPPATLSYTFLLSPHLDTLDSFLVDVTLPINFFHRYKAVCSAGVNSKMCMICSPRTPCGVHFQYKIFSLSTFIVADMKK